MEFPRSEPDHYSSRALLKKSVSPDVFAPPALPLSIAYTHFFIFISTGGILRPTISRTILQSSCNKHSHPPHLHLYQPYHIRSCNHLSTSIHALFIYISTGCIPRPTRSHTILQSSFYKHSPLFIYISTGGILRPIISRTILQSSFNKYSHPGGSVTVVEAEFIFGFEPQVGAILFN